MYRVYIYLHKIINMKKFLTFLILSCVYFSALTQINLTNGLVAHYPFDGDVKDYSGQNNNGNIAGSPTLTKDRNGNTNSAYKFNGNGDHIWVKDHQTLRPDSALTISAWVYCEDFSSWNVVVSKRAVHNGSPWNSYILYAAGTAGSSQNWSVGIATSKTQTHFAVEQPVVETKKWLHLVGIYEQNVATKVDESGKPFLNLRLYVDGVLVKQEAASGKLYYTDSSLRIGMAIPGPSLQYFKGIIDDVRIYNRGLNNSEINALFLGQTTQSVNQVETANSYQLFPNPTDKVLFVSGNNAETLEIDVFDNTGRLVLDNAKVSQNTIDISTLTTGIYFAHLFDASKQVVKIEKILIK